MAQLNTTRIEEIKKLGRKTLTDRDLDALVILALDRLAQASARARRDQETQALQTSLAEETEKLQKVARLYSEANQTLARTKRDLAHTDNYAQSLVGRLQDAVAKEKAIREWQVEFELSVQKCIDRKELGPVAAQSVTLLRLQEALESTIHEAPPAK